MKRILVACAVGVNTSEILASKIQELLIEKEGWDLEIESAKINDVKSLENDFDVIVSLANITDAHKPVVIGVDLLTGVNPERVIDEIKSHLEEK